MTDERQHPGDGRLDPGDDHSDPGHVEDRPEVGGNSADPADMSADRGERSADAEAAVSPDGGRDDDRADDPPADRGDNPSSDRDDPPADRGDPPADLSDPPPSDPRPGRGGRKDRASRPIDPSRPCMNCGDPTPGEFCPSCGQRKVDVRVSVRTLVMDVLEDQFLLDRRLPRTLGALFFRPGRLTVEHVNGRIVRYIHPFRLYLVSSLIFFILLSFTSLRAVRRVLDDEDTQIGQVADAPARLDTALEEVRSELEDPELTADERAELEETRTMLLGQLREARADSLEREIAALDSALATLDTVTTGELPGGVAAALEANRAAIEGRRAAMAAERDSVAADTTGGTARRPDERTVSEVFGWDTNEMNVDVSFGIAAVDSAAVGQIRRLGAMTPREATETVVGTFFNYVPTMMFVLLPVFAGVLKLLYVRRSRFYAEHFVFLLHVHSFVFLLLTIMILLREYVAGWLELVLFAWMLIYIYLAMRRVYGQGWLKTFAKYWTLGWMYFWILTLGIPVVFVAALLLF